jgi:hypothetical protein
MMKVIGLLEEGSLGRQEESKEKVEDNSNGKYMQHRKPGTLRPGKLYTVRIESTPAELRNTVRKAYYRKEKTGRKTGSKAGLPSLVKTYNEDTLFLSYDDQKWDAEQGIYKMYDRKGRRRHSFSEREVYEGKGKRNYEGKQLACTFQSEHTGTLKLLLKREVNRGKDRTRVRFSDLTVSFLLSFDLLSTFFFSF